MTTINEFLIPLSERAKNIIIRMTEEGYNYRINKVFYTVRPINRDADIADAFCNLTKRRLGFEENCGVKAVDEIVKAFAKHGLTLKDY